MSFKQTMGIVVAVGIILALGIEFWTLGEMIWRGLTGQETQRNSRKHETPEIGDTFTIDFIQGEYKILRLVPDESTWTFYGILVLSNQSTSNKTIRVVSVELHNGEQLSIQSKIDLKPNEKHNIQFRLTLSPGSSPIRLKMVVEGPPSDTSKWFTLPKVPVRSPG